MVQSQYSWRQVLSLAYQSFGISFAVLGTSPIYVYTVTLSGKLSQYRYQTEEVIFGVFSLIFWTLTLVSLCKHAICMLTVDDNGEGGLFALYALLCRHAKLGLLPNNQAADEELTPYRNPCQTCRTVPTSRMIRRSIERLTKRKTTLLVVVMLGASMAVIMGVLTPAITMLSSIEGIRVQKSLDQSHLVAVTCAVLVGLFVMKHRGTYWAAFIFPPIVIVWLLSIAAIGIYNIIIWNPNIYKALSPYYVQTFFRCTGWHGWVSLCGTLLCLAGTGAIFADVGHFPASSMRVGFFSVTYPCLVIQYMGQAAFLSRNFSASDHSFYASIPDPFFWPIFVIAILVAIIAGQSIISASCSVVKQSHALGCFPRVKILHTSRSLLGRTFIPEINWILMILCLSVIIGFRDTKHIAYAYGIAFVTTELVTTWLMSLVINLVYHKNLGLSIAFFIIFNSIEMIYFSSAFLKITKGGWCSLLLAVASMIMMFAWHYASRKKYLYDLHNKIPMKGIFTLGPSLGVVRVPGIAFFYTELVSGIPSTFSHFLANLPAFYEVVVFICVKTVPIPYVPNKERYLVGRIGPKSYRMYRCIMRNGYKDVPQKEDDLENDIIMSIAEFIQLESEDFGSRNCSMDGRMAIVRASARYGRNLSVSASTHNRASKTASVTSILGSSKSPALLKLQATYEQEADQLVHPRAVQFQMLDADFTSPQVKEELLQLVKANDAGVTYIIGHSCVRAKSNSSRLKKSMINAIYSLLRKNCRRPMVALNIPQVCLIEVGMNYHV